MLTKCSSLFVYISGKMIGVYFLILILTLTSNLHRSGLLLMLWLSVSWVCPGLLAGYTWTTIRGRRPSMFYSTPLQVLGVLKKE